MKGDFGQSFEIMLREACQVLEPAENPLYRRPLLVGCLELLRTMTPKLPINPKNAFDTNLLVSWIRNNWERPMLHGCFPQICSAVLRICQELSGFYVS